MAPISLFVFFFVISTTSAYMDVPKLTLNNGRQIPALALGTFLGIGQDGPIQSKNKELCHVIEKAIDLGYRHIDTAAIYGTEAEIGEGIANKIADGTVRREDVFVSTKLWNSHHKRDQVAAALNETLSKMGLDYIDLYLMHWPLSLDSNNKASTTDYMETWRAMEEAHQQGLVRAIGLSNFNREQILRVMKEGRVQPAALQIEIHPQIVQKELVEFAQASGLIVMGFSPFGAMVSRYGMVFPGPKTTDKVLVDIAERHNKTVPQIVLGWLANRKIIPVAKSMNPYRLKENINIFDIKLNQEEISTIEQYNSNTRFTLPSFWQENVNYPFEKIPNPVPDPFGK